MRRLLLVGAVLLSASLAYADIGPRPRPGPQPQPRPQPQPAGAAKAKFTVEIDDKATEARLIVPLQAVLGGGGGLGIGGGFGVGGGGFQGGPGAGQLGGPPPGGGFGGFQGGPIPGGQPSEPPKEQPAKPKTSSLSFATIVVGLSLTLALSMGGLWLVRRKSGTGNGLVTPIVLLVAIVSVSIMSGAIWANGAPPFRPRPAPQPQAPPAFPAISKLDGVKVELVPQGDTIRLILTSKQKEALQKAEPKK